MGNRTRRAPMRPEIAIAYDFDGTLCDEPMQNYRLLPQLGYEGGAAIDRFWRNSNRIARKAAADPICVYMHQLLAAAARRKWPLTAARLAAAGRAVRLRPGLEGRSSWFVRTGRMAARHGLTLRHYIISSGLAEIIAGTSIAGWFAPDRIFASRYLYDAAGHAVAPAWTINHTTKTQFLFRINKGMLDLGDDRSINDYVPDDRRPVPFSRIIFIGDGSTDIPCFSIVRKEGGFAIAVFAVDALAASHDQITGLINDKRIDGVAGGDFGAGSILEGLLARIIDDIGRQHADGPRSARQNG